MDEAMPDDDDEPRKRRFRVKVGTKCWMISGTGRWHLVRVLESPLPLHIRVESVVGYCNDRIENWPYPDGLVIKRSSALMQRLRPLRDRVCNTSM